MLQILNRYDDGDYEIIEYTKDGVTISHTVRALKSQMVEGEVLPPMPKPLNQELDELKQRQELMQLALDEIILGGGF